MNRNFLYAISAALIIISQPSSDELCKTLISAMTLTIGFLVIWIFGKEIKNSSCRFLVIMFVIALLSLFIWYYIRPLSDSIISKLAKESLKDYPILNSGLAYITNAVYPLLLISLLYFGFFPPEEENKYKLKLFRSV